MNKKIKMYPKNGHIIASGTNEFEAFFQFLEKVIMQGYAPDEVEFEILPPSGKQDTYLVIGQILDDKNIN